LGLRYVGLLHCHYGERGGLHALGWRRAALALRLPQSFHLCFYNLLLRTASSLGALGISLVEEKARRKTRSWIDGTGFPVRLLVGHLHSNLGMLQLLMIDFKKKNLI